MGVGGCLQRRLDIRGVSLELHQLLADRAVVGGDLAVRVGIADTLRQIDSACRVGGAETDRFAVGLDPQRPLLRSWPDGDRLAADHDGLGLAGNALGGEARIHAIRRQLAIDIVDHIGDRAGLGAHLSQVDIYIM